MATIRVQCVEHDLTIINNPLLASGSFGVDSIQFSFCPAWEGYTKTAAFYPKNASPKFVILDSTEKCDIPPEVMLSDEEFEFGVFGMKEGKILSSKIMKYRIKAGSYSEGLIGEPSPNVYEQITSELTSIEADLEEIVSATEELESFLSTV